jgi:hypothetical protein
MSLQISESLPLSRFVYDQEWTPIKGAWVLPLVFFGTDRTLDPNDYLEVMRVIPIGDADVAVTRGGGLFVRDRGQYNSPESRDRLADSLNLLLAEFAVQGLPSKPITDIEIHDGKLIGRHAAIVGGGGRFADRTWGPFALLASPPRDLANSAGHVGATYWPVNFYWFVHDESLLDRACELRNALRLQQISQSLPSLLVAAIYNVERHNLPEAIISAWIVCEELISFLWDEYVNTNTDRKRRDRLNDHRTYSASVRLDMLLAEKVLAPELNQVVHEARRVRNALAHRASISRSAAEACDLALRELLHRVGVSTGRLPGYTSSASGIGGPRRVLEPPFAFR